MLADDTENTRERASVGLQGSLGVPNRLADF